MTLWVPADRLLAVIDKRPDAALVLSTAAERRVRDMRAGHVPFVSLDAADRWLTRLDLHEWWHIPAAYGGLADIYEDEAQYGSPARVQDGRRRVWREAKRRLRGRDLPGPRACAWCGCVFTPHKNAREDRRDYCSRVCGRAAYWTAKAPGRVAA